jgi:hypothetical protein
MFRNLFKSRPYPALTGFYFYFFFWFEPLSLLGPLLACLDPAKGPAWLYHSLVPLGDEVTPLPPRSLMAIGQLANAYLLLATAITFSHRLIRELTAHDVVAQEQLVGVLLFILSLGDITHLIPTLLALPEDLRFNPGAWNVMLHGNVNVVIVLLLVRLAWFYGIGRKSYYFTVRDSQIKV